MNILNHIVGIDLGVNYLAVPLMVKETPGSFTAARSRTSARKPLPCENACRHGTKSAKWKLKKLREKAPKSTSQSCPVYGNTTKANRYRKRHESHVVLRVIDAVRNIEYVSPKPSLHHNHHSRKCHKPIHTLSHNINVDLLNNPASKDTSG